MLLPEEFLKELVNIPGCYVYYGACSVQYCFPLKNGGELRFSQDDETYPEVHIDHYDGAIPPGVTGPVVFTRAPDKEQHDT